MKPVKFDHTNNNTKLSEFEYIIYSTLDITHLHKKPRKSYEFTNMSTYGKCYPPHCIKRINIHWYHMNKKIAHVIGNQGLGDTITYIGMVNYLSCKHDKIFVACIKKFYNQIRLFFTKPNIIVYPIDEVIETNMYDYAKMMKGLRHIYDIYSFGNYDGIRVDNNRYMKLMENGSERKVITNYPTSYYSDVNIPLDVMTKYFSVVYPTDIMGVYDELLGNSDYQKYRVIHQVGSNARIDIIYLAGLNIEETLTIDVNTNLYPISHKFHNIASKFVNLRSVVYYAKLLENANELYLIDSCIHALALVVDVSKASPRICYKRESRFNYGIPDKFVYSQIVFHIT